MNIKQLTNPRTREGSLNSSYSFPRMWFPSYYDMKIKISMDITVLDAPSNINQEDFNLRLGPPQYKQRFI